MNPGSRKLPKEIESGWRRRALLYRSGAASGPSLTRQSEHVSKQSGSGTRTTPPAPKDKSGEGGDSRDRWQQRSYTSICAVLNSSSFFLLAPRGPEEGKGGEEDGASRHRKYANDDGGRIIQKRWSARRLSSQIAAVLPDDAGMLPVMREVSVGRRETKRKQQRSFLAAAHSWISPLPQTSACVDKKRPRQK